MADEGKNGFRDLSDSELAAQICGGDPLSNNQSNSLVESCEESSLANEGNCILNTQQEQKMIPPEALQT